MQRPLPDNHREGRFGKEAQVFIQRPWRLGVPSRVTRFGGGARGSVGRSDRLAGLEPNDLGGSYCLQFVQDPPPNTEPYNGKTMNVCTGQVQLSNKTGNQIVAAPWKVNVYSGKLDLQEIVGDPVSVPEGQERSVKYVKLNAREFIPNLNPSAPSTRIYVIYGRTLDEVRPSQHDPKKFPNVRPETSLRVLVGSVTADFLPPLKPVAPSAKKTGGRVLGGRSFRYQPAFISGLF
jgi:hypothetical protein